MSEFTLRQISVIIYYIAAGFIFSLLFDIITLSQKIFKYSRVVTVIEDTLFWILFIIVFYLLNYNINDGAIEGFTIFGMFLSSGIYFALTRYIFKRKKK